MSTATNGWEIPKGNGREGRSYNFQIKLCEKRSALSGCPVVDERNISKSGKFRNFLLPELWLLFREIFRGKLPFSKHYVIGKSCFPLQISNQPPFEIANFLLHQ